MKLIVGLGNPGKEYEHTRHNMGYDTIDLLANSLNIKINKEKFQGIYGKEDNIILFKPTTFMNLSGIAVRAIMDFYKIKIDDLLVISDDMDLPVGKIRLRERGSSGGHKGIQNIIDNIGSNEFKRIKIGIGRHNIATNDYVLGKPTKEERVLIDKAINDGKDAILLWLKESFTKAMSEYN